MNDDVLSRIREDESPHAARAFADLAASLFERARRDDVPVSTPLVPHEIAERFNEPLPAEGEPLGQVVQRLAADVIADANHLLHPMAVGHQVSAPLPAAVWTEVVTAALNQSVAVAEMSPTLTQVERRVVAWFTELAGFGDNASGTFTSGGTEATFTALAAARAAIMPDAWQEGVGADPPYVLCGEHSHYAVTRAVGQLGIGASRAVRVASNGRFSMDSAALERELLELQAAGKRVMAVVATSGSTATGSFDDLEAIGNICEPRGLWLHVDGAHGASALLSPNHRHRLSGLRHARSLAWDPHKMMLMPLAAGVVLVRDGRDLAAAFSQSAPYLFHGDSAASPDLGPLSFMCSRRTDALKVWVALKRYGADGMAALYDQLCERAAYLHARVSEHPEFEPFHTPESNILCFGWNAGSGEATMEPELRDTLTDELRTRYNRSGAGWLSVTTLAGRRVLRVTVMNPRTTHAHLDALLKGLSTEGAAVLRERGAVPAA